MRPLALNAYRTWPTGDLLAKILNFFNVKIDLQNVQVGTVVEFHSLSNTIQYLAILASTVPSTTLCAKLNADSTLQTSITRYITKRNVYAFQRPAKRNTCSFQNFYVTNFTYHKPYHIHLQYNIANIDVD